jgi:hypothetical protein
MARKKVHYYWTEWVDYGIKQYQSTTDIQERDKIYRKYLRVPFEQMSEIITKRWNWNYIPTDFDDLKHEMVSHMLSKMHNFNPDKGKSFGYFTLILKNYLIQMNNKNYKETKKRRPMRQLYSRGYVDGYGSTGSKTNWQNVNSIIKKKEDFYSYIDFLERHGKEILGSPQNEIIEPLIRFVKDIDNTKYLYRGDFVRYVKDNTNFDNHLLFVTTKILKNLYRKFISKISSQEEMKRWIKCLIWKPK